MSDPKEVGGKTRSGLPPEVEAALDRRDAELQAHSATQIRQPSIDLQRTLYGNPHDAPNRPSAPRPQLPPERAFVPPTPQRPAAAVTTQPTPQRPAAGATPQPPPQRPALLGTTQPPPSAAPARAFVTAQRAPSAAPRALDRTTLGVPDAAPTAASRASTPAVADGSIVRQVRVVGVGGTSAPSPTATSKSAPVAGPRATAPNQNIGRGIDAPTQQVGRGIDGQAQNVRRGIEAPTQQVGRGISGPMQSVGRGIAAPKQSSGRGISAPMQRIGGSDGPNQNAAAMSEPPAPGEARVIAGSSSRPAQSGGAPTQNLGRGINAPTQNLGPEVSAPRKHIGHALDSPPASSYPRAASPTAGYGENSPVVRPELGSEPAQPRSGFGTATAIHAATQAATPPLPSKRPSQALGDKVDDSRPNQPQHLVTPRDAGAASQPLAAGSAPAAAARVSTVIAAPSKPRAPATPLSAPAPRTEPAAPQRSSRALNLSALVPGAPAAGGGGTSSLLDTTEPDRDSRDQPSSARRSQLIAAGSAAAIDQARGTAAAVASPQPPSAAQASEPSSDALALGPGMQATRLVSMDAPPRSAWYVRSSSVPAPAENSRSSHSGIAGERPLALHVAEPDRNPAPVRRWPALVLIGLALVMFTGVIAVRAPALLPAPIARVVLTLIASAGLAPHPNSAVAPVASAPAAAYDSAAPPAVPESPTEAAAAAPANEQVGAAARANQPDGVVDRADVGASTQANDQVDEAARANDQVAAAAQADQQFAAPMAPITALQGASAELEKQAIDALLANDFASARGSYERLRVAEPGRPEYPLMLELLAREPQATCGRPGQPECAAP